MKDLDLYVKFIEILAMIFIEIKIIGYFCRERKKNIKECFQHRLIGKDRFKRWIIMFCLSLIRS